MTTITDAIADRATALKSVADQADEMLDYFYLNLGLKRPSNNKEE